MEKQHKSGEIINNGMKALIERHPNRKLGYVSSVQQYIENTPGAKPYHRSHIMKVVHDQAPLTADNKIIKVAFLEMYYGLYPDERELIGRADHELETV